MSRTKSHLPFIYNPAELTKSELIENFVIRQHEFEQIFDIIKKDNMQNPPQHIIIQGQRGTGKTTLLLRLSYAIKDEPELNKWLIPIVSDEESWGISTLAEFWKHTAEDLEDISDDFIGITAEIEVYENDENFAEKSFKILQNKLNLNNKKIVLFIDNFGDLVKKFGKQELQRLREVLLTSPDIRIVAASSVVLEFNYEYSEPFYEFFKVFRLQSLKKKEAENLLLKLGKSYRAREVKEIIKNNPQRVEALRRITSGVPRTIVLLYEIFVDNENGNAFRDLELALDRVTPLYKHRMDDLKPIPQKIINTLALNWDAMAVKDISSQTKIISKQVSAQLSYLEKNSIVTKTRTNTKNHLYYLSERFFNIWYLMRRGRKKHKNRVRFLVEFLELWCTPQELLKVASELKESMHKGTVFEKHALYMTEALAYTSIQPSEHHSLTEETRKFLETKKSELVDELSLSDVEIYYKAAELLKNSDERNALLMIDKIRNKMLFNNNSLIGEIYSNEYKNFKKAEEYYLKAVDKGNSGAMFNLALLYHNEYKDFKKAEEYYLKVVDQRHSSAMFNLALLYMNEYKDFKKAEEYYLKAVDQGHSDAMNNLAMLYENEYKDFKKAEKYYLKAVNEGHSDAMNSLGALYADEHKDFKKAEEYFLKAMDKGDSGGMFNLGLLYKNEYKNFKRAEEYFLKAVEQDDSEAMSSLGELYADEFKDFKKAEEYFLMAIEQGDPRAMNSLGALYADEHKDFKKAEEYFLMAMDKGDPGAMFNLGLLYHNEHKDFKKAEEYYLRAVDKGDSDAMFSLALLYENEYKDFKKAEEYFLMAAELGDYKAMNGLAWMLFESKERKKEALDFAKNSIVIKKEFTNLHTLLVVLLWNDDIEDAVNTWKTELFKEEYIDKWIKEISEILNFFIAKKQNNFIYKLFQENKFEIKERYKPIYYALLHFMGEKYLDESRKMGPELKETVDEIIETVKQMEKDYK